MILDYLAADAAGAAETACALGAITAPFVCIFLTLLTFIIIGFAAFPGSLAGAAIAKLVIQNKPNANIAIFFIFSPPYAKPL